jgi:hypothetical protein
LLAQTTRQIASYAKDGGDSAGRGTASLEQVTSVGSHASGERRNITTTEGVTRKVAGKNGSVAEDITGFIFSALHVLPITDFIFSALHVLPQFVQDKIDGDMYAARTS